jgi:hypothetical protein
VGLAPTGKRRLFTAHAEIGRSRDRDGTARFTHKLAANFAAAVTLAAIVIWWL